MDKQEIFDILRKKLQQNMDAYKATLLQCAPMELIERAAEIYAAESVYGELCSGDYAMEHYEYLLRFENPLELARDHWQSYQELSFHDEMSRVFDDMMEQDNEMCYTLDPGYAVPFEYEGMGMT